MADLSPEIIRLIGVHRADGFTVKQTAHALGISARSVRLHVPPSPARNSNKRMPHPCRICGGPATITEDYLRRGRYAYCSKLCLSRCRSFGRQPGPGPGATRAVKSAGRNYRTTFEATEVPPEVFTSRQVAKSRACLSCHKIFPSEHSGNRLCARCAANGSAQSGLTTSYPLAGLHVR